VPWGALLEGIKRLACCKGRVRAVLRAGGPGSPPGSRGHGGKCLITRDQPPIRREDGDSPPLGLLRFHSLQVPHPQPWVLHPRGFNRQVPFPCSYVALLT